MPQTGVEFLTERAAQGMFYNELEAVLGEGWGAKVSRQLPSTQKLEQHGWLGQSPAMREWIGDRKGKKPRAFKYSLLNKKYETTMEFDEDDVTFDKSGQIQARINDLATRVQEHREKLLSDVIIAGETATCYDGQTFFSTAHLEGDSGTQSNDIALTNAGAGSAPTAAEMEAHILQLIRVILGLKDDQGEPMNGGAKQFQVMVPVTSIWEKAVSAINNPIIVDGSTSRSNSIVTGLGGFSVELIANPRLTWTDKFMVARTDGNVAPFIWQEMGRPRTTSNWIGSEFHHDTDEVQIGVKALRAAGYGYWQYAALGTMS